MTKSYWFRSSDSARYRPRHWPEVDILAYDGIYLTQFDRTVSAQITPIVCVSDSTEDLRSAPTVVFSSVISHQSHYVLYCTTPQRSATIKNSHKPDRQQQWHDTGMFHRLLWAHILHLCVQYYRLGWCAHGERAVSGITAIQIVVCVAIAQCSYVTVFTWHM